VRRVKDDYYAKSTVATGAYQVPASVGTSLDKTLDDFRNKKLFDFGYEDPNKIEIHAGSKAYFLTRSGSDWWGPEGKKRDPSSVEALLGNLRNLAATAFRESGFSTPVLELIVTSNDGKRVERVSVAKQGTTYAAKREGEPGLYELASAAVEQLQESAANVKPSNAPTK
jgi:hypothetical protein